MASLVRNFLIGFFLLAFSTILPHGVMAQAADRDIDAKIKRLEQLEAKVDVKLKKLESLEARLEARLEPEVQPVVARVQDPLASSGNGHGIVSAGVTSAATAAVASASAVGSVPGQDKDQWGGQVSFRGGFTLLDSPARSRVFTGGGTNKGGYMAGGALDVPLMRDPWDGQSSFRSDLGGLYRCRWKNYLCYHRRARKTVALKDRNLTEVPN